MEMRIDETEWPLVVVSWSDLPSDSTLSQFLTSLTLWLDRGERFGLLLDTRGSGLLSPEQRVRVLSHMKAEAGRTKELLLQAIVIQSLVQRTLFYGVNLLFPNPFPSKVFAEVEPARAWLLATLAQSPS
jgi:hypothetical protein